jgi:diguanylate cyclase (GGDEF)-like protein
VFKQYKKMKTHDDSEDGTARRISPRWMLAIAAVVVIGFSVICGTVLLSMRRGDENLAQQTLGNLAATIDADIARNIEMYDLSLRAVASSLTMPEVMQATKKIRQLILFDHAATARHFGAIQVMNATGEVTIDSSTLEPIAQNFADEEFYSIHRKDPLFGLYISKPRLHNGAYGIVLSRRVSTHDGAFAGVVSGFIHYTYFHEMIERLQLENHDMITVMRQDGVVIARSPFDMDVIGKDISYMGGVQKVLAAMSGSFEGRATNDQVVRLFVWREGSHPLIVLVGRSLEDIFGQWRHEALQIATAMGALGLIACGVMLLLAREMRKRALIEDKMARLAMTDGLTGLSNRRHFDATVETEWRRGIRHKRPLALLMIDADHFKAFNDRHGHQAGDAILADIAHCIGRHAKRAGDCAARYGGEEFALVLPGFTLAEAITLGERIRVEVLSLHAAAASTTVSIGVASLVPNAMSHPGHLIREADRALYAAKEHGRNQTFPGATPSESWSPGLSPEMSNA